MVAHFAETYKPDFWALRQSDSPHDFDLMWGDGRFDMDVLDTGFEEESGHLNFLLIWRKGDHKLLFAGHPVQVLHICKFDRRIAAEGNFYGMGVSHPYQVHRPFRKTGISKSRDGKKSALF